MKNNWRTVAHYTICDSSTCLFAFRIARQIWNSIRKSHWFHFMHIYSSVNSYLSSTICTCICTTAFSFQEFQNLFCQLLFHGSGRRFCTWTRKNIMAVCGLLSILVTSIAGWKTWRSLKINKYFFLSIVFTTLTLNYRFLVRKAITA